MLARPRPVLAAAIAASLVSATARAETCPNEQPGAAADANLGHCLGDAREARKADEPRLAASAYGRAVKFARAAYDAGKAGAPAEWFTDAGDQIVHYGTEGCSLATHLPGERAREVLTTCIGLLDDYLADLGRTGAGESRSAEVASQRRSELQPLLDAQASAAPAPEVAAPTSTPTPPPPPPIEPEPAPRPDTPPAPPPSPRALDAGIGVSAGIAGLAVIGLVAGDQLGRKASAAVLSGPGATSVDAGVEICGAEPSAAGCADLKSAKNLFIASGVLLGVSLAATAVFAGLRVRHGRAERRARAARVRPDLGGVTVRF